MLKCCKSRQAVDSCTICACHSNRRLRDNAGLGLEGILSVVVVLSAHFGIFCNLLPSCFAANESTSHGARYHGTDTKQNGGSQDNIRAPGHVGSEQKDVDYEGQKTDDKSNDGEDEESEKISGRVCRGMPVGDNSHNKEDEGKKRGDGMNDQDSGETVTHALRNVERFVIGP